MEVIKRTAVRNTHRTTKAGKEVSRMFAIVTSKIIELSGGRKKAATTVELCGGRIDKNDNVRWSGTMKEFCLHEEPVVETMWNEQAYLMTWHGVAVDLMTSVVENPYTADITEYGDYY